MDNGAVKIIALQSQVNLNARFFLLYFIGNVDVYAIGLFRPFIVLAFVDYHVKFNINSRLNKNKQQERLLEEVPCNCKKRIISFVVHQDKSLRTDYFSVQF